MPTAYERFNLPICGIMGTVRLVAGMYLIVITKKRNVGSLLGHAVWKAVDFDTQDNKTFLSMINNVLTTDGFYFCTDYDLTHTVQRLANVSHDFQEMSLLERADQRFVWNGSLLREFLAQPELHRFAIPVVHGCIDSEGHAANFVETEQIVLYNGGRASFVQRPNLKYKPKPLISKNTNHMDGFQRHFDSQVLIYGKQTILNLVNQKGSEKPLEQAFAKMVTGMENGMIKYVAFDFHKECSGMRWDRLNILVDSVAETQDEYGYFMVDTEGKVLSQQKGTFRSNCMDCLDRTNVIQSMLARRSIQSQLQRMGVLHLAQRIEEQADFEKIYKNGKRTQMGLVMDGVNSAIRYYKNNFSDGFRQDSIDLFLGNYAVDETDGPTPLHIQKDWKFLTLPIIMVVAFSMCIICLLMAGDTWTETLAYLLFWGTAAAVTASVIVFNGRDFVDAPKLVQKEKMD
ncbi:unnamed protein product [Coregonus sp. 'balchen']|nr:unnamed protein product [Coregonus sp. 'balchen']